MLKINLNNDQYLWFTSDSHYNHTNLVKDITRWRNSKGEVPSDVRNFSSLEEMNNAIVNNINKFINEDDILIHLGDWSFGGFENIKIFRDKIKCKTIHLITGNHDRHIIANTDNIRSIFESVSEYYTELKVGEDKFILCHFPIASWDKMAKGIPHLHGHTHLRPIHRLGQGKSLDVGMDGNDMYPIGLAEIKYIMSKQPCKPLILPSDHHDDHWTEIKGS